MPPFQGGKYSFNENTFFCIERMKPILGTRDKQVHMVCLLHKYKAVVPEINVILSLIYLM
jgi:hypothetical protein